MREHQPRWRILIFLLVAFFTIIAVVIYLALGVMGAEGALVALRSISLVAVLGWMLWVVFRRWAWRWRVFRGWLANKPDVNGKWLGTAQSSYIDTASGQPVGPIEVMLEIVQTFTSTHVAFCALSLTSRSNSVTANFITDPDAKRCRLVYTYLNEPGALADGLDMHFGTAILDIFGEPPSKMEGCYMTSREEQTKGVLKLTRQTR